MARIVPSLLAAALLAHAESTFGGAPDLAAIVERADTSTLHFPTAVDAAGFELPVPYGTLEIQAGVLVPARTQGDDAVREAVFVGRARLRLDPPDAIEAQQLVVHQGLPEIDAPVESAVLVLGDGSLVERLAAREAITVPEEIRATAETIWKQWVHDAGREGFGASTALLRAAAGDPVGRGFLGFWLQSSTLGGVFYAFDPSNEEAVTFGAFELFDAEAFKTRRLRRWERSVARAKQKRERRQGEPATEPEPDEPAEREPCHPAPYDEEDQDRDEPVEWQRIWMSARDPAIGPNDEPPGVEPDHYSIDLSLTETGDGLFAEGAASLRLRPNTDGLSIVPLRLGPALEICDVRGPDGETLPFDRREWDVLVALATPTVAQQSFELTVRFAGYPIDHWLARRTQRYSMHWYPHAGRLDHATYDVTLRWPRELTLVASGRAVEGGEAVGQHWTRRVLDVRTIGFSFEIDDLDVIEDHVGHLALTFAFHRRDNRMTEALRAEIIRAAKATLLFYETRLGWLPIEHVTFVSVDRNFSQGLLGFITLAEGMIHAQPVGLTDNRTAQEARLEVIAHEIAHQWWGHAVGWDSYRDQWLSEALADFSAASFMTLIASKPEVYQRKRAEASRNALKTRTFDGRQAASLGSVLLGVRLAANHGPGVYHAIVYDKGSTIFTTLAQRLGTEETWKMLGNLTRAVQNRVIRTSTFFDALERMSGEDLEAFVEQYVRGAGLPVVFHDHIVRKTDAGWLVEGTVRQLPSEQHRYVLRRTRAGWDVVRQAAEITDVANWTTVAPYVIEAAGDAIEQPPQRLAGHLTLRGEITPFALPVDWRPTGFRLDPEGQLLADTSAEDAGPGKQRVLLAVHLIGLGRVDEGLALLDVAAEDGDAELTARLHLVRARAMLDRGDADAARSELRRAEAALPGKSDYAAGERAVLGTRIDSSTGRFDSALAVLHEYLGANALELRSIRTDRLLDPSKLTAFQINRGEALALLAIGAYEQRDPDRALLVRLAQLNGVDMRALGR